MSFGYWFQAGSKYCRCVCLCVCLRVCLAAAEAYHRPPSATGQSHTAQRDPLLWCDEKEPRCCCLCRCLMLFLAPSHPGTDYTAEAQLVGCLSVCLPVCTLAQRFNLTPLSISTLGAAVELCLSCRKWCKGGLNDKASCDANVPSSLPTRGQCTNARRDARRPSKACSEKTYPNTHSF